jgi:hypothetical protein
MNVDRKTIQSRSTDAVFERGENSTISKSDTNSDAKQPRQKRFQEFEVRKPSYAPHL